MTYSALVLTVVIGLGLLPKDLRLSWGPRLATAFATGAFAISVEMFVFDVIGIGWNIVVLLIPWAGWIGFRCYRLGLGWLPKPTFELEKGHGILLLCLVPLALLLPYERTMPLTLQTWDSWAIWLFKAKAFFVDGTTSTYLSRSAEFQGQPGYPLLIPLYGTFIYLCNGEVADQAAKFYSPCFFVVLAALVHGFSRRFANVTTSSALTVVLCLIPAVATVAFELPGYADTALAAYLVAGGGFLYAFLREGRIQDLWGMSVAASAAAWTKNEGQVFLAVVFALGAVGILRHQGPRSQWKLLIAPGAVLMTVWSLVRSSQGVEAAGFYPGISFHTDLFARSAAALVVKAFAPQLFAFAFFLFLAAIILWKPLAGPLEFWCLPAAVLAQAGAALLAYSTGRNEIEWWLGTSADRILSQVAPLGLLPVAVLLGTWDDRSGVAGKKARPDDSASGKRRKRRR